MTYQQKLKQRLTNQATKEQIKAFNRIAGKCEIVDINFYTILQNEAPALMVYFNTNTGREMVAEIANNGFRLETKPLYLYH